MTMNNIVSSLPTTPGYLSKLADKLESRMMEKTDEKIDSFSKSNVELNADEAPVAKKGHFSPGKVVFRTAVGVAVGAAAIALSGGGVIATAALGAGIWGVIGAGVGAVTGALGGKVIEKTGAGALLGGAIGGVVGVGGGALKGAILGGLAGVFGGNPLGGAIAGGLLSAIGI